MRFAVLSSGSSGNATVVGNSTGAVLIDCGVSLRELKRRAALIDFDLSSLNAILVTHEHEDHVGNAATVARSFDLPVYATRGTQEAAAAKLGKLTNLQVIGTETPFTIGDIEIMPVIVPHDAREPCQFVLSTATFRLGVLTDLGKSTPHLERCFSDLDALVVEFNHDCALLADGPYPGALKSRIAGDYGHLSNADAMQLVSRLKSSRLRYLVAAHLSEKTNDPELVRECLDQLDLQHTRCSIARQDAPMPWTDLALA